MIKGTSYHPVAKFFHWTLVSLVVIQFVSSWFMTGARGGVEPNFFTVIHFYWGFLIIPFAALLFLMRFYRPVARPEIETNVLLKRITVSTHYLFYLLLLLVPLSGWAATLVNETHISFFGLFMMPVFVVGTTSFLHILGVSHPGLATLFEVVAVGHISAALYHHFVLKDAVLERMRPGGKK